MERNPMLTRKPNGQLLLDGQPVLTKYIRDKRNQKIGMVVALVINDEIRLGWSCANTKLGDRFNKNLGLKVCIGRAFNHPELELPFKNYKLDGHTVDIPHHVREYLERMYYRSRNYFKYVLNK